MSEDISKHTLPELWRQSADNANYPYILQTGNLVWNGTAWEKWDGQNEKATATDEGSGAVTIGNTDTAIVGANADRKEIILVNDSDEPMYLAYGEAAVMNQGIRLNAHGGSIVETVWTGAIKGICATGGKELIYVEL